MAADGMMRASDADRDAVVAVLRDAYAAGRLTLEEFDERTSAAYAGRTWGQLRELTADLPEEPALGADVPGAAFPPSRPADWRDPAGQTIPLSAAKPVDTPGLEGRSDPANLPPGMPRRPVRPAGSIMPFVMLWFLIVVATRPGAVVVVPVLVVTVLLLVTAVSRRK